MDYQMWSEMKSNEARREAEEYRMVKAASQARRARLRQRLEKIFAALGSSHTNQWIQAVK